jgi:acetyl-CoA acetyltransferase
MTGIPIINVNNNCATGSTAIYVAHEMISGGRVSCALALGFDRMEPGSLGMKYHDRTNPLDKIFINTLEITQKSDPAPFAPQIFGNAGMEHMQKYGTKEEHFAKVAYKNHLHSVNNPYAQFRT